MISLRISAAIADEWAGRGIDDVIPGVPRPAYGGGVISVTPEIAREILADCEFNGDTRGGPESMPGGTRRAYQALAAQLRRSLS
ncbi:MAG: Eisosome component PIL1/LSP1 family protein [Sulfuritalea sp.]|nr:Eisosome component PIL1/LSP1 family protein [Sulfuritalea sp.]